ncbi:hypothetical protein [Paenibacillus piri]|uniref:Asp/Glu racemase n=1 Tax=Paenibacillus piri TaxID=2547395 RepID=A0A4R5KFC4_9BACL|nr:hypothetical protein [Paenibacillus piri]TDF94071.1 hypothetical protein E1757_24540 [Paenibacillus piri]
MTRKVGCFHAHYSNIEYIQQAMEPYDVELVHFVDPGLDRLKMDTGFTVGQSRQKIAETLHWIASCHVDAILVTCTYFTANITESLEKELPVPVVKIDDPMLALICGSSEPQLLVFTNPATVDGTMTRIHQYACSTGTEPQLQTHLLEHTFPLMMAGKKQAYVEQVTEGLERLAARYPGYRLWAVQLSMAPAAARVSTAGGTAIGNPLEALAVEMSKRLGLELQARS